MFIWGSGHKTLKIPIGDLHPCEVCAQSGRKFLLIDYDYGHIFWLFKGLKNKIVSVECEQCATVSTVDKTTEKIIFASRGGNPIPLPGQSGTIGWAVNHSRNAIRFDHKHYNG